MVANKPILLDLNIVIYTGLIPYKAVREWLKSRTFFVPAITHLEVLGYYQLTRKDEGYFRAFFEEAKVIPIKNEIIQKANGFRIRKKK